MQLNAALEFITSKRHGTLITQRANGRPQSSNIVYVVDDADEGQGGIVISLTADRAKTKNLQRSPLASLHVNRDDFWAYVVIDADVTLSPVTQRVDDDTADRLVTYYRAIAGEHDDWDEFRAAMVAEQRLLATLTPTHAYGILDR